MGTDTRTYAYQPAHLTLHAEGIDLLIELSIGHATLEDITEYQGATALVADSSRHEVECDVERVDVGIV